MNAPGCPQQEFDAFVRPRRAAWVRSARRILRSADDAEDLVQETLSQVWTQWVRQPIARPAAYVARAVVINAIKRRSRHRPMPTLLIDDHAAPHEAPGEPSFAVDAMQLERALAQLPPAQQAVLRARFYVGLTFAEIGKTMSVSTNTAASRCRYALATLRRRLGRK